MHEVPLAFMAVFRQASLEPRPSGSELECSSDLAQTRGELVVGVKADYLTRGLGL